jgi:hypothetical protein
VSGVVLLAEARGGSLRGARGVGTLAVPPCRAGAGTGGPGGPCGRLTLTWCPSGARAPAPACPSSACPSGTGTCGAGCAAPHQGVIAQGVKRAPISNRRPPPEQRALQCLSQPLMGPAQSCRGGLWALSGGGACILRALPRRAPEGNPHVAGRLVVVRERRHAGHDAQHLACGGERAGRRSRAGGPRGGRALARASGSRARARRPLRAAARQGFAHLPRSPRA